MESKLEYVANKKLPFIAKQDGTIWYMDTGTGSTEHPVIHVQAGLNWIMKVCKNQQVWPSSTPLILPRPGIPTWHLKNDLSNSHDLEDAMTSPALEPPILGPTFMQPAPEPAHAPEAPSQPAPGAAPPATAEPAGVHGVPDVPAAAAGGVPDEPAAADSEPAVRGDRHWDKRAWDASSWGHNSWWDGHRSEAGWQTHDKKVNVVELRQAKSQTEYDAMWNNLKVTLFQEWPLSELMMYWWHLDRGNRDATHLHWLNGLLPSFALAELALLQHWQEQDYRSALDDVQDTFEPSRFIWPVETGIPGLQGWSNELLQVVGRERAVPGGLDEQSALSMIQGSRPPSNMGVYVQAKRQFFWAFRKMADGQIRASKVSGRSTMDGYYRVTGVESLRHNFTLIHEYKLTKVLFATDNRGIKLPLVLAFVKASGETAGADLHLYHCALCPATVVAALNNQIF
jgi:hypothetical protein